MGVSFWTRDEACGGEDFLGPEAKGSGLCKRNLMPSDLTRALRTQHRKVGDNVFTWWQMVWTGSPKAGFLSGPGSITV